MFRKIPIKIEFGCPADKIVWKTRVAINLVSLSYHQKLSKIIQNAPKINFRSEILKNFFFVRLPSHADG